MGIVAIDGFNLAVSAVTILRLLPEEKDEHKNNLNAGICLIIYGCGNSIAGYFGGRLCDKYLIKKTMTGNLVIYCTSCLVSLAGWYVREFWLAAVGCFLWGVVQASMMAGLMVVCSRIYGGHYESFAVVKQFHCICYLVYQVVMMSTGNAIPVSYIMMFLLLLVIPAYYGLLKMPNESIEEIKQRFVENSDEIL